MQYFCVHILAKKSWDSDSFSCLCIYDVMREKNPSTFAFDKYAPITVEKTMLFLKRSDFTHQVTTCISKDIFMKLSWQNYVF